MGYIEYTHKRVRGNEDPFPATTSSRTREDALESLVVAELAFGGQITACELTPDGKAFISVKTHVMNCVDTAEFRGDLEDMKALLEVGAYADGLVRSVLTTDNPLSKAVYDALPNTFAIVHAAPILVGGISMMIAMAALVGVAHPEKLKGKTTERLRDLTVAYGLMRYQGYSQQEVISMLIFQEEQSK